MERARKGRKGNFRLAKSTHVPLPPSLTLRPSIARTHALALSGPPNSNTTSEGSDMREVERWRAASMRSKKLTQKYVISFSPNEFSNVVGVPSFLGSWVGSFVSKSPLLSDSNYAGQRTNGRTTADARRRKIGLKTCVWREDPFARPAEGVSHRDS